jgi:hypothetical protein
MSAKAFRVLLVALIAVGGACGDDGGDDAGDEGDADDTPTSAAPITVPASSPGRGAISLGGSIVDLTVTKCDAPVPGQLSLTATGDGRGGAANVEVTRAESSGAEAETTFTDTITYSDGARVYQALRYEVAGEVNDPRDPTATTPMLQIDGAHVTGRGVAGPPGDDETRVDVVLDVTCTEPPA